MAKEIVRVKIDKNTGDATVLVENVIGQSCTDLTEDLEVQLGRVTETKPTPEYYKRDLPFSDSFISGK